MRFPLRMLSTKANIHLPATISKAGYFSMQLPLPGVKGLAQVEFPSRSNTIHDFITKLQDLDESIGQIAVVDLEGTQIAKCTPLRALSPGDFRIHIDDIVVATLKDTEAPEQDLFTSDPTESEEERAFNNVCKILHQDPRLHMSLDEYYSLCEANGVYRDVAKQWLTVLQRSGRISYFDHSTNPVLSNTLFLHPNSSEMQQKLLDGLDLKQTKLHSKIATSQVELEKKTAELHKYETIHQDIEDRAERILRRYKWLTFVALNAQFGGLAYLVWDVESWDVMEPITYFIGFTVVLGTSAYHSLTKRDATYSNIWQRSLHKRMDRMYKAKNIDPKYREQLKDEIDSLERRINSLTRCVPIVK